MYTGLADAPDQSTGPEVFRIADGYAAAWHISEEAADTTATKLYRNAVEDTNHGNDFILSTDREGIIGNGHYFSEADHIRVVNPTQRLRPPSTVSLSAWFKVDSNDTRSGTIATMGVSYALRLAPGENLRTFIYNDSSYQNCTSVNSDNLTIRDNKWHHVTGTYDGSLLHLYVDGRYLKAESRPGGIDYTAEHHPGNVNWPVRPYFLIGISGSSFPPIWFQGHIDEVQVSTNVRSADWIKLSYETQKENSKVVRVEN